MVYFEKLNKAWRDGIDAVIMDCDGGKNPDIAAAFREQHAQYLDEIVIGKTPTKTDREEVGDSYVDFTQGWKAALKKDARSRRVTMKSKEVVAFIQHYTEHNGFIKDPEFLQGGDGTAQLKLKWVDIAHALDALGRKLQPGFGDKEEGGKC